MTDPITVRSACRLRKVTPLKLPKGMGQPQARAIRLVKQKWVKGTELTYFFLELPGSSWPANEKDAVRDAFKTWQSLGVSMTFREVSRAADAMIRIGFVDGDGSWSWVGTQMKTSQEPDGRNMNFGWSLLTSWGRATALHEIGHAMGMPHEHQNPKSGIVWNVPAVLEAYAGDPNYWSETDTRHNIINPLSLSEVEGSNWDPTSIMHYPFEAGLIDKPDSYRINGTPENTRLSPNDEAWVRQWFPLLSSATPVAAGATESLATAVGSQSNFTISPKVDREYTLRTQGTADTVIVLYQQDGDDQTQLAADDDSAEPRNASLTVALKAGRQYVARVRTNYAAPGQAVAFHVD